MDFAILPAMQAVGGGEGGGLLTCCLDAGARAVKANCAPQAIAFFTLLDKFEGAADDHRFIFGFFFSF